MRKGSDLKSFHLAWNNIDGNIRFRRLKESLDFLKTYSRAPEEASWFYVHEITFQNLTKKDHVSHDEILSGSLYSNINYRIPPGLASVPISETFPTLINGTIIERSKLGLYVNPISDNWQRYFPSGSPQNYLGRSTQFALRRSLNFFVETHSRTGMLNIGTGGYKPPFGPTVNLSNIKYPFILNRNLEFPSTGLPTTVPHSTSYYRNIGLDIPFKEDEGVNLLKFMNPQYNSYGSGREEEEFQKLSGDYTEKLNMNNQISVMMDIVKALANPIHHAGLYFRMFKQLGDVYLSYKDEKAREKDALKSYFGGEVHSMEIAGNPYTGSSYNRYLMKTDESLSLTVPTKKIYYTVNDEKIEHQESKNVTVPINRLFKSYEEFVTELNLEKYKPPLSREFELIKNIRITPYMENEILNEILYKENQYMSK